jgi:hypothetical protein
MIYGCCQPLNVIIEPLGVTAGPLNVITGPLNVITGPRPGDLSPHVPRQMAGSGPGHDGERACHDGERAGHDGRAAALASMGHDLRMTTVGIQR